MNNVKKCIVGLGLILIMNMAHVQAVERSSYSLNDLYKLALNHNPDLEHSQLQIQKAHAKLGEAHSSQRPKVTLQSEISQAWMRNNDFSRTANQLQMTYPIYNPSLESNRVISELNLKSQDYRNEALHQAMFKQLGNAYYEYWKAEAQWQFLEKERLFLIETMRQLKQRMKVGYQGLDEVLELKARLANLDSKRIAAQSMMTLQLNQIEQIVGKSLKTSMLVMPERSNQLNTQPLTMVEIASAIRQHPLMQSLDLQKQAQQKTIEKVKHKDGLEVELFGMVTNNDSDGRFFDDMRGTRAGVRLSWPLYLGGATDYRTQQAQVETMQLQSRISSQKLMLQTQIKNALLEVQTLQQRIKAERKNYQAQKAVLNATKQAIYTGKKSVIDLLDVQRKLNRVERDLSLLNTDLEIQNIHLKWALGHLNLSSTELPRYSRD